MVSYDAVAVTPREEALKMGDQVFFTVGEANWHLF